MDSLNDESSVDAGFLQGIIRGQLNEPSVTVCETVATGMGSLVFGFLISLGACSMLVIAESFTITSFMASVLAKHIYNCATTFLIPFEGCAKT